MTKSVRATIIQILSVEVLRTANRNRTLRLINHIADKSFLRQAYVDLLLKLFAVMKISVDSRNRRIKKSMILRKRSLPNAVKRTARSIVLRTR